MLYCLYWIICWLSGCIRLHNITWLIYFNFKFKIFCWQFTFSRTDTTLFPCLIRFFLDLYFSFAQISSSCGYVTLNYEMHFFPESYISVFQSVHAPENKIWVIFYPPRNNIRCMCAWFAFIFIILANPWLLSS